MNTKKYFKYFKIQLVKSLCNTVKKKNIFKAQPLTQGKQVNNKANVAIQPKFTSDHPQNSREGQVDEVRPANISAQTQHITHVGVNQL